MKQLKYKAQHFVFILVSVLLLGSCTKNFENINTPPEGATDASTPAVYNAIVSSLPMSSGQYSVMNAWMYSITQQAITTGGSYPYENANTEVWTNYYSALANYRLLQSRISATADSTTMNNLSAMLRTIMAYQTFRVTNYFGDMPYFKAGYAPLDGSVGYKAPFDKQSDIYASILADLQWAVNNFSENADQYSVGTSETFLNNDIALWTKFANSLRLYVAVTMYDKDNATAGSPDIRCDQQTPAGRWGRYWFVACEYSGTSVSMEKLVLFRKLLSPFGHHDVEPDVGKQQYGW